MFLCAIELISATIIAGLVGAYLHDVSDASAQANGRLAYTVAFTGISTNWYLLLYGLYASSEMLIL